VPDGDAPWERLVREAVGALESDELAGSEILRRNVGALENNAVRVAAVGFALRRAAGVSGDPIDAEAVARLRAAEDPTLEAGLVARQLAKPTRVDRLVRAALEDKQTKSSVKSDPDRFGAEEDFLTLFAPGEPVWDAIQSWARVELRAVARRRTRALLDAAGAGPEYDLDEVLDRLDVDHLLRLGFVLAACEEELLPSPR
jgi:hypothetical protein